MLQEASTVNMIRFGGFAHTDFLLQVGLAQGVSHAGFRLSVRTRSTWKGAAARSVASKAISRGFSPACLART